MNYNIFINYLYVALGGALGSILRVYLSSSVPHTDYIKFPIQILSINILGCFLMGLLTELMGIHISANYNTRLFLISGLLGGFTTFSAFSLEFALLWEKSLHGSALFYTLFSVLFSILAFFLGVKIVKLY